MKAELQISHYKANVTGNSLKPIVQIENLKVKFGNKEAIFMDSLLFESFDQIIVEEKPSILSSSKEIITCVPDRKSEGKETEDKLEVENSKAIVKSKEELRMRINLDMAIEDPEKWLALELSGMNKEDEGESPQKKFKMDLKPPEANSSANEEDYFNLFQEEPGYMSDIEKDLISEEPKDNIIKPLAKRKFEELENESAIITEDKMDQGFDRGIKKGIKQRIEIRPEGKLVESGDDLKLYQQNNESLKINLNKEEDLKT
ncbi:hypothetical protein O181_007607 [Austropuccinia psidii MF-1]|uniref:Uncharacterized protein n=1 Tax=Austropuccinia psidii MF-1 TaxID=1389203 RepID=A0A9Q3GIM9_9BASI|nr:hypothetical protein [Austropuccinia psidii MF-1]